MDEHDVLRRAAELGTEWFVSSAERPIAPTASIAELRDALGGPLPETGAPDLEVIEGLARDGEPGLTAMGSGRFFGFVIGGTLPAALAADWLVSAWDQNAGLLLPTPTAAVVEEIAGHVGHGAPRAPGDGVVRLRHRLPDGAHDRARGGPGRGAPPGRLERRGTGAPGRRRRSGSSPGRSATSRSTGHCACSGSASTRCGSSPPTTRAACAPSSSPPRSPRATGRRS